MNGYNRESTHSASYVIPAIASEVLFCYAYAVVRCPSVRLSVMFVYSIEMNKYSFKIFSPSTSHTVFHTKRYDNITTETPTWRKKSRFSTNHWLWHQSLLDRRVSSALRGALCIIRLRDQQTPPRHASANIVYDRKPQRYTEDNRT